ncbi:DUF6887 family protein [Iningainema tapete]|uniref:Uncharacterized protein n=1 Tax=Iningainema tapete BLCC-T55 TaxID=2748662 RepID=A0A8J6XP28_9CYAN|nr:hypothetical protein [Iningainema tapete]MBD2778673.1 hypothetical protein [Iningainema tapete BLCC-T55]
MTKPNFSTMTKSELKQYLIEHQNDNEAFEALMDKIYAEPESKLYTVDDVEILENLIKAKRRSV